MSCCGQGQRGSWQGAAVQQGRTSAIWFESQVAAPVTLFGRITGIRYHFPGVGARVRVDARDAPTLDVVRGLERVALSA